MHHTIISAEQFRAERKPSWIVLDCRFDLGAPLWGEQAWRAGHLPGAHYLHLENQLSGSKTGSNGRHPLPDAQNLAQEFAALGIGADSQVITYDDAGGVYAARAWWLLRWLGHDQVALLDGGVRAFVAAGGALDQETPGRQQRRFVAQPQRAQWVDSATLQDNLGSGQLTVVDARSPQRFIGQEETMDPVGGHIPGALNRFYRDNLTAQEGFKPAQQLRQEWLTLLGPERHSADVVHQCGSGVTACVNLLAMEIAGLRASRLYPGSWSEWCADAARPVARD